MLNCSCDFLYYKALVKSKKKRVRAVRWECPEESSPADHAANSTGDGADSLKRLLKPDWSGILHSEVPRMHSDTTSQTCSQISLDSRLEEMRRGTARQATRDAAHSRPNRAFFETVVRESPCTIRIHARVSQKMQCSENTQNSSTISISGL